MHIIDGCPESTNEPLLKSTPNIMFSWPETDINDSVSLPCPCQDVLRMSTETQNEKFTVNRRCGGSYSKGAHWEKVDFKTNCGLTNIALELCQANIVRL